MLSRASTLTVRIALSLRISCLPDAFSEKRANQHICNMALLTTEYDKTITKRKTSKSSYFPRTHKTSDRIGTYNFLQRINEVLEVNIISVGFNVILKEFFDPVPHPVLEQESKNCHCHLQQEYKHNCSTEL